MAYRADFNLACNVGCVIDIEHVKIDTLEVAGELLKDRGDHPARATPLCPEVEDGRFIFCDLEMVHVQCNQCVSEYSLFS